MELQSASVWGGKKDEMGGGGELADLRRGKRKKKNTGFRQSCGNERGGEGENQSQGWKGEEEVISGKIRTVQLAKMEKGRGYKITSCLGSVDAGNPILD